MNLPKVFTDTDQRTISGRYWIYDFTSCNGVRIIKEVESSPQDLTQNLQDPGRHGGTIWIWCHIILECILSTQKTQKYQCSVGDVLAMIVKKTTLYISQGYRLKLTDQWVLILGIVTPPSLRHTLGIIFSFQTILMSFQRNLRTSGVHSCMGLRLGLLLILRD